jgi:hypothetical protein
LIKVIHGTWIPRATNDYLQEGAFCLWVEKNVPNRGQKHPGEHPATLRKDQLETCLKEELGIQGTHHSSIIHGITPQYFTIPTFEVENPKDRIPVKSYELLKYSGEEPLRHFSLHPWKIWCYEAPLHEVVKLLKDLHFLLAYHGLDILLGMDLLFWFHYTQAFKEIILKDQYIPALQYRELPPPKDKRRKYYDTFQIYPTWGIASPTKICCANAAGLCCRSGKATEKWSAFLEGRVAPALFGKFVSRNYRCYQIHQQME